MKKAILTFVLICAAAISFGQDTKIEATYNGFDGTYYTFTDANDEYYEFTSCSPSVLKQFDLHSEELLYEYFVVVFTKIKDEDGEETLEIKSLSIVIDEEDEE